MERRLRRFHRAKYSNNLRSAKRNAGNVRIQLLFFSYRHRLSIASRTRGIKIKNFLRRHQLPSIAVTYIVKGDWRRLWRRRRKIPGFKDPFHGLPVSHYHKKETITGKCHYTDMPSRVYERWITLLFVPFKANISKGTIQTSRWDLP